MIRARGPQTKVGVIIDDAGDGTGDGDDDDDSHDGDEDDDEDDNDSKANDYDGGDGDDDSSGGGAGSATTPKTPVVPTRPKYVEYPDHDFTGGDIACSTDEADACETK